jgi:hypothetical protein
MHSIYPPIRLIESRFDFPYNADTFICELGREGGDVTVERGEERGREAFVGIWGSWLWGAGGRFGSQSTG